MPKPPFTVRDALVSGRPVNRAKHLPSRKVMAMLADMESYTEARTSLSAAERAGADSYVDYPPTPR